MLNSTANSIQGYLPRKTNWTSIRLLNIYRLGLASIFFIQTFLENSPFLIVVHLGLYSWTSFAYVILSLVWILAAWIERRGFQQQINLQIYSDIILLTLLMHACGGVTSGLGMLLIIPIAVSGLLTQRTIAIIFASLATLGLLAEYIYSSINISNFNGNSTQVGILGATLFATAIITHHLINRLRSSEQLIKQRERDLASLSALNQEIINNLQAGVIVLTEAHAVFHINLAAQKLLGTLDPKTFNRAEDSPKLFSILKKWSESTDQDQLFLPSQTGIDNLQVSFRRLSTLDQTYIMVFLNDVTSVRTSMQQAKLASLGHLTANIAHEIRNPLGAISYAAQLLSENEDLPDSELRMTQIITQHTDRINHIIEDILKISRGSATAIEIFGIANWLERFLEDFYLSEQTNNRFNLEVIEPDPMIKFDSGHLRQIMTNLCHNALTHGDKNKPVRIQAYSNDNNMITIEIADSGPGIDADSLDKVFEPFFTTSHQGSGLGLYIVSQLCDLNDASITATRNNYNGTSFIIQGQPGLSAADLTVQSSK
jgi:two-component system, NtrC family, sensor histidine kinase PilS